MAASRDLRKQSKQGADQGSVVNSATETTCPTNSSLDLRQTDSIDILFPAAPPLHYPDNTEPTICTDDETVHQTQSVHVTAGINSAALAPRTELCTQRGCHPDLHPQASGPGVHRRLNDWALAMKCHEHAMTSVEAATVHCQAAGVRKTEAMSVRSSVMLTSGSFSSCFQEPPNPTCHML